MTWEGKNPAVLEAAEDGENIALIVLKRDKSID